MITDKDVTKLKKTFATKQDLGLLRKSLKKDFNGRIDFLQSELEESLNVVLERIGQLIERMDATNKRLEEQGKRQDAILEELRANRIVLGSHEQRLQKVEFKVFPQT
ncbi:hypothetical protein A3C98_01290 [Candidatus Roizmanbacteria bacterium RIFCSPHIGHO2_02_FULL_37_15]|nr:MAG: hypothetical protein A3C98_01290 [Candidatus Roizmanbacteria bacterium RIFCSPHIGHO2_02_FULL_37_15]OGK33187.1 MAG: hypothetical protein A3F57_01245 [Candidatus Roizmanbacteria bacterium RIFCSPHIGHO2_12_FULL_36_11]OGK56559.1 MAG: hypothetical protein A3I50_01510 [Candidatus Roizmanbacteria bacterium RIFCSPLOWO2_02_FULL_37_9]